MDYSKIGKFIEEERKRLNMTQMKLAEKLFVSDKTISKWENGKGIPDTESLKKMSEIFGISINEILCGEKSNHSNTSQNEKLLLDMTKEISNKNKIIWSSMWVIMLVSIMGLMVSISVAALLIPEGVWQLVVIIAATVLFLIPCFYALKLEVSVGTYKCKICGNEIIPTYNEALWAMHRGTTRHLKCPNCNKRTWHKKVIK